MQDIAQKITMKINMRLKRYRGIYGSVAEKSGISRSAVQMRFLRGEPTIMRMVLKEALARQMDVEKESKKIRELIIELDSTQQ